MVACAGVVGLALMAQAATVSSATYDEVAYLRVASDWWRKGETSEITRMGSPLTFFKLQAGPAFFVLDRIGLGGLIDRPIVDQASLLPIVRLASLWIWLAAFGLTVYWSRLVYGPRAMAFAACLFALSPNLLAHGSIATMEMPLVASTAGLFLLFWRFLETRRRGFFIAGAAVAGLAFSCKFTTVVYPPILGLLWAVDLWRRGERRFGRIAWTVGLGMAGFVAVMLATDWAATGFATIRAEPEDGVAPVGPRAGMAARTADAAGLGGLRHAASPPAERRPELPAGRASDDRVVVLLPGGAGGEGAARVAGSCSWRELGLVGSAVRTLRTRRGVRRPTLRDWLFPAGDRRVPGDRDARLEAELRRPLPPADGAAGDRLGVGPGRAAGGLAMDRRGRIDRPGVRDRDDPSA